MKYEEFKENVGKDICVKYPFLNEIQYWSMKNFYFDENGEIKHNRIPLIMEAFIKNAECFVEEVATHG